MDVARTFGLVFLGILAGSIFKDEYHFPTEEKISKAHMDYKDNEKLLKGLDQDLRQPK